MHHFTYRQGVGGGRILHAEDLSLADLADSVGTPFYCYSTATLERHYRVFADAFTGADAEVCYSVKANSNQAVIKTLAELKLGAGGATEDRTWARGHDPEHEQEVADDGPHQRSLDDVEIAGPHE